MKSLKLMGITAMFMLGTLAACSDDSNNSPVDNRNWSTDGGLRAADNLLFSDTVIGNGDSEFVFTGTQTLRKGTYKLMGWVYVANGATLTIEPGTVIKGDKTTRAALIVERGGKLIAQGTSSEPIVFTSAQAKGSRRPGDWGGLILCGNAKNNKTEMQIEGGPRTKHGGSNNADNSGILSYVRVEFAGYPFEADKEINGITLGSVGSGTQIDHIQVSYSNDDSYEWFGGAVNCKYLVAYHGWDDEFDTDNGFSGNVQFCLSIRDPKIADVSQSNGFESDNIAEGASVEPYTSAVFSNVTFMGPKSQATDFENTTTYINGGNVYPNNGSGLGKFQAAMHLRRNTRLSCFNSLAIGYPVGLILDNEKGNTQGAATAGNMKLQNIWFADMTAVGTDYNKIYVDGLYDYTTKTVDETQPSFSSTFFKAQVGNTVTTSEALNMDGYMPTSTSPFLSSASFTDAMLNGFDNVSYVGAFSATEDWTAGWTEFDPQNANY